MPSGASATAMMMPDASVMPKLLRTGIALDPSRPNVSSVVAADSATPIQTAPISAWLRMQPSRRKTA